MFTDADFFGITFPMDLDVRMKAVMLGACFLIVRIILEQFIRLTYCVITIYLFVIHRMQCSSKKQLTKKMTALECSELDILTITINKKTEHCHKFAHAYLQSILEIRGNKCFDIEYTQFPRLGIIVRLNDYHQSSLDNSAYKCLQRSETNKYFLH